MKDNNVIISVIVPVYNSEQTLRELRKRLKKVLASLVEDRYELVFVNDGSIDSSWTILKDIATNDERIIAINLTRNFGQHNALMCGFSHVRGSYIITIDDDLQNPPEEIPKLFQEIQKGHDAVYGIFETKKHSKFRNFGSNCIQFVYRKTYSTGELSTMPVVDAAARSMLPWGPMTYHLCLS